MEPRNCNMVMLKDSTVTGSGFVTVSKYFAGGEGAKEKETGNDATEVNDEENTPEIQTDYALSRGRRLFRGNSGA
jgi:hypothetical protein